MERYTSEQLAEVAQEQPIQTREQKEAERDAVFFETHTRVMENAVQGTYPEPEGRAMDYALAQMMGDQLYIHNHSEDRIWLSQDGTKVSTSDGGPRRYSSDKGDCMALVIWWLSKKYHHIAQCNQGGFLIVTVNNDKLDAKGSQGISSDAYMDAAKTPAYIAQAIFRAGKELGL
jgi:hypothetical protein